MKKISFSEQYGLQQAVIKGTKPITRRAEKSLSLLDELSEWHISDYTQKEGFRISFIRKDGIRGEDYIKPRYAIGEVVAIAQRYKDCWDYYQQLWEAKNDPSDWHTPDAILGDQVNETPGWKNKMFVRADLMPHRIRITNIRVERLQDITDEDCMKEGIIHVKWRQYLKQDIDDFSPQPYKDHDIWTLPMYEEGFLNAWAEQKQGEYAAESARIAFAVLINRISGRGTWERNPWVFVYEFKLIK